MQSQLRHRQFIIQSVETADRTLWSKWTKLDQSQMQKRKLKNGRVKIANVQGATISNDKFTNSFQIVLSCFPLVLHRLDILVL